jgi:excisionase family DNA binding protein
MVQVSRHDFEGNNQSCESPKELESLNDNQLLTVAQVAKRLSVSKRTVYRLAAAGQLLPVRISAKLIRFEPARVERWIKDSHKRSRPRRRSRKRPTSSNAGGTCRNSEAVVDLSVGSVRTQTERR